MENSIVRIEPDAAAVQPASIWMPFRVMAGVVGPMMFIVAEEIVRSGVRLALAARWGELRHLVGYDGIWVIGFAVFGWKLLQAAYTGFDPASVHHAQAEAESRAMLAAVRATGEARPGPSRRGAGGDAAG